MARDHKKHGDDLTDGIGVNVAVAQAALATHRHHRRPALQREAKLLLESRPERIAGQRSAGDAVDILLRQDAGCGQG